MNASNQPDPQTMPALRGRYVLRVQEQGETLSTHHTPNLITQQGLDDFAAYPAPVLLAQAALGVSSVPASDEQTRLQAQVGAPALASNLTVSHTDDTDLLTAEYVFPEGSFDNVDLAEVGVFTQHGKLFSRALFRNPQGDTEPITVARTQRVVLTYVLELLRPQAPQEAQLVFAGRAGSYRVRVFPQDVPRYQKVGGVLQEFGPSPQSLNLCTLKVITAAGYAGIPGTAPGADTEVAPTGHLVLDPYVPGTRRRQLALRVDSQYGNKTNGITGLEVVHPTLGTVMTLTVEPALTKTADYRVYFDTALEW